MKRRGFIKSTLAVIGAFLVGAPRPANDRMAEVWMVGWMPLEFESIKTGDIFRLYEPDGTVVEEGTPMEIVCAQCDAHPVTLPTGTKTWGVMAEPVSQDILARIKQQGK